ncbi:protein FAM13A [Nilaparvata lugens]|uniref:protein FAM13A n=1 Tax=Nilaparvata lugens TaxID=108931 RepID=UPI00193E8BF4|nr:protein FAM13A [Nilaparvata lugens]
MRRPTFCHNSVAAVEATHRGQPTPPSQGAPTIDKEETRLARMKRIFTGSLLMGRRPPTGPPLKTFAVHLEDLPLTNEGLPRVVVRITTFIEKYGLQLEGLFRLSGGNPTLVEQLKASFDRTGDADLEGCGDVTSVAALLKLWLRDLPEPVVPAVTAAELVSLLHKYKGGADDTEAWCSETGRLLCCWGGQGVPGQGVLRERNARLLRCILRLLHRYQLNQLATHQINQQTTQNQLMQNQLAPVFAALLLSVDDAMPRIASPDTTAVVCALIANYDRVYDESMSCGDVKMDGASTPETRLFSAGKNKSLNLSETTPLQLAYSGSKKQRKRKDRQSSADRKFVRSNSEERPCKSSCGGVLVVGGAGGVAGGAGVGDESIRRVSSHEDFSRARSHHKGAQPLMELISETAACIQMSTPSARPLHERNQQFVRSSSTNNPSPNNTTKNNNLNNNNSSAVKVIPEYKNNNVKVTSPEFNNNNKPESADPLPWQHDVTDARRDESLAVSVVCSPPSTLLDEEEEREHERRRSSERFAPCPSGGGVGVMGRRGRGENGERRRRKVVSRGSVGSHGRRHGRSPRRERETDRETETETGDSSSKENEDLEQIRTPVSGGASRRCSTLMVVSPPAQRNRSPLASQQASFSGEEETGGGGSEGGGGVGEGSLSRSSTEESEEELNEPKHDPDASAEDEKAEPESTKNAEVELGEEEEVKGDVEELEEEDEDDDDEEVEEEEEGGEEVNSDEPVLDLNRLHRDVDLSEPVPSRHDWSFAPPLPQPQQDEASSLRSSATFAAGHRAFEAAQAVSEAAAATPSDQLPLSGRTHISVIEHHHAKQIHTLKKRLKRYEEGFEREFGYKPSSADKMANPDTKKMCLSLSKLRRELKQLKSESTLCQSSSMSQLLFLASGDRVSVASAASATKVINEDVVHDVEKRLNDKRQSARRPSVLEEMSREQLADEKTLVQRALLQLEAVYGRPNTREQRDLVRPLYDRYRQLKRLLARAVAAAKLKEGVAELGTILEHEQMDFSSSSPPPPPAPIAASLLPPAAIATAPVQARPTTPDYFENLHALPRNELLDQHKTTREEKKRLRRQLHEFEDELESKMGRKLQREDRQPMDALYTQYKHVKAKLRLIEALITKK